jgi:hypothetical protein
LVERTESPEKLNKLGGENSGQVVYNGKEKTLFLFFKNDKLESYITTEGRKDSPALIMLNNTIYTITRDKEKYSIIPTSSEGAKENSLPSIGNIGKKKKKFLLMIQIILLLQIVITIVKKGLKALMNGSLKTKVMPANTFLPGLISKKNTRFF